MGGAGLTSQVATQANKVLPDILKRTENAPRTIASRRVVRKAPWVPCGLPKSVRHRGNESETWTTVAALDDVRNNAITRTRRA